MKDVIMVVDDEPVVLGYLRELLGLYGYNIEAYSNGHDALEAFYDNPERYRLIISDQTMPGLLGDELITKIHSMKKIPAVLCTGYSDNICLEKAKNIGAYDFVAKPFDTAEFLRIVKTGFNKMDEPCD